MANHSNKPDSPPIWDQFAKGDISSWVEFEHQREERLPSVPSVSVKVIARGRLNQHAFLDIEPMLGQLNSFFSVRGPTLDVRI